MAAIRALVDTNFLLDAAVSSRPEAASALSIFNAAEDSRVRLFVSAGSLKDFYYIARKCGLSDAQRRDFIALFMDACKVVPVDRATCAAALASSETDFEDGIVRSCAEAAKCSFVVSRDKGAFLDAHFEKVSPADLAQRLGLAGQDAPV